MVRSLPIGGLAAMALASGLSACAQAGSPPASLEALVREAYPGWTIQPALDEYCPRDASVAGHFNDDDARDYAVRLTRGDQGLVVAFLSAGGRYDRIVLDRGTRQQIVSQFLQMAPRGSRQDVIVGEARDPRRPMILAHDAPAGGQCESSSWIYVIEGARVTQAFTSD